MASLATRLVLSLLYLYISGLPPGAPEPVATTPGIKISSFTIIPTQPSSVIVPRNAYGGGVMEPSEKGGDAPGGFITPKQETVPPTTDAPATEIHQQSSPTLDHQPEPSKP